MYELYKPFRNYLRQFPLVDSLQCLWAYSEHIANKRPLPAQMRFPDQLGQSAQVYPWEIDLLAREIILNAGTVGNRSLATWQEFSTVINRLRDLDNKISENYISEGRILRDIHRIIHHQIPAQRKTTVHSIMRAYKIFDTPEMRNILEESTGITLDAYFRLGLVCGGHFLRDFGITTEQDYSVLGISPDVTKKFFERFTVPLKSLREETIAQQRYDDSWSYAFNPLRRWPFVQFDLSHPERILCPIPTFIMRRFSDGLFYDVVDHAKFSNAFCRAFEAYIGAVLNSILDSSFTIRAEEKYRVGKNLKHGVDWVVSDRTGHLFIECKTRRLRYEAKFIVNNGGLEAALGELAGFIVQHYKNIIEAIDGKSSWMSDGLPVYPLIVTLEDWWMFSPPIIEVLTNCIHARLDANQIDRSVLDTMPYSIASADEFETALRVSSKTGLAEFFGLKRSKEHRDWAISHFSRELFRKEIRQPHKPLFAEEFMRFGIPQPQ